MTPARDAFLRLTRHPLVNRSARSVVRGLATRANYHVVRGMADAEARPDVGRFLEAMPWSLTSDYVRQGTAELLCRDIEELGAKVLHQWATLGPFDFVNVVEAPDNATIARVSVALGARGSAKFQTLSALSIDEFLGAVS